VVSTWKAYQSFRDSVFSAARERLPNVTNQFAGLQQTQAEQLKALIARAAANDTIRRFFEHPTSQARLNALAVMRHMGPLPELVIGVELWSAQRERLLTTLTQGSYFGTGGEAESIQWAEQLDTGAIGRLQLIGDSLAYPSTAMVSDHAGTLGYVVQWWRGSATPKSREAITQLIGNGARLFVGNDRGDFWTDLVDKVPKPPLDVRQASGVMTYERPGTGRVLAAARPVGNVPWEVLIEFPERLVAQPVTLFVRELLLAGSPCIWATPPNMNRVISTASPSCTSPTSRGTAPTPISPTGSPRS
jgi:hypothetical protein